MALRCRARTFCSATLMVVCLAYDHKRARVTDAQLRSDVLEYLTVYGCLSALAAAAVAVTVAVGDTA